MAKIEGTSALKAGEKFTLDQWRTWPEGERWELIGGIAYAMSPAPRVPHQRLLGKLYTAIASFFNGKPCEPFIAPVDVFLPDGVEDDVDTVVQPDLFVVCDPSKVQDDGVHGAPDFIVEIVSESTAFKDMSDKKELYERAGVREYWIVNPRTLSIFRYELAGDRFAPAVEIVRGEAAASVAFPGFFWRAE
jgi:Uma2 family endonuclease